VDRIKKCGVEAYRKATTVGLALLAGNGKLKVKMVLTGEGTGLNHVVEGEIDLPARGN